MSTEHLLGDFGTILHLLVGTDNNARQEAEKHLKGLCVQFPGDSLLLLAQIGAQGVGGFQLDQRLLALVLLRRLAFQPLEGIHLNPQQPYPTAPFDVAGEKRFISRIETVFSVGLKEENDVKLRRGLGDCIATWITQSSNRQRPCYTLASTLFELMGNQDPNKRFTSWQIINLSPTLLVDSVAEPISPQQMSQLLIRAMTDIDRKICVEGVKAMRSVVLEALTGYERDLIGSSLVFQAFQSLRGLFPVTGDREDQRTEIAESLLPLVDLSSTYPALFAYSLDTSLPVLLSLLSPIQINSTDHKFSSYPPSNFVFQDDYDELANPSTELLLSLAELRRDQFVLWQDGTAPKEMVGMLIGRLVAGLQGIDDGVEEWKAETDFEQEDEDYPSFAEEAIDRLAVSLCGDIMLPALSPHVQAMLQLPDWRCRYAALVFIGSVAEGCTEQLQQSVSDVLKLIWPSLNDPHPRVRYAFAHCMGQLCKDLEETLQKQYPQDTLSAMLQLLKDPEPRVRAHAGACMVNFFDDSEIPPLVPLLNDVVQTLFKAFHQGPLYIQVQIMPTLASVAMHAGTAFMPFYRESIDLVLSILTAPSNESHRQLIGRAIECGSIIGMAMGKAVFAGDAPKLAAVMMTIQNSVTATDDPRSRYLIDAWGTYCRTLGQDFKPFLPHVIPPLIKAAAFKPSSPSGNLGLAEEDATDMSNVHTSEMDDKILAFDNLTVYAHTLAGSFQPYLDECMQLTLDALTFRYSEDVRESAAFLVPALLYVAKESNAWAGAADPLEHVFKTMIDAIVKEVDFGFLALLYKSFTDSLQIVGIALPPSLCTRFLQTSRSVINDLKARREDRLAQEEYMDEGDLQIYQEEEGEEKTALDHLSKALGVLREFDPSDQVKREVDSLWSHLGQVGAMVLGRDCLPG